MNGNEYGVNAWMKWQCHYGTFEIEWKIENCTWNILRCHLDSFLTILKLFDTVLFSPVFHYFSLLPSFHFSSCSICTWKIFIHFTLSSSPLSINFSIFDGIAHAHHWFHCKFRRTYNPRSMKKFFLYAQAWRTEWERTHPLQFSTSKSDGAIIKFKEEKKISRNFFLSQFLKSTKSILM